MALIVDDKEFHLEPLKSPGSLRNLYNGVATVESDYIKFATERPKDLSLMGNNITMRAGFMFLKTNERKKPEACWKFHQYWSLVILLRDKNLIYSELEIIPNALFRFESVKGFGHLIVFDFL